MVKTDVGNVASREVLAVHMTMLRQHESIQSCAIGVLI